MTGRVDESIAGEGVTDRLHNILGDVLIVITTNLGEIERLQLRIVDCSSTRERSQPPSLRSEGAYAFPQS